MPERGDATHQKEGSPSQVESCRACKCKRRNQKLNKKSKNVHMYTDMQGKKIMYNSKKRKYLIGVSVCYNIHKNSTTTHCLSSSIETVAPSDSGGDIRGSRGIGLIVHFKV